MAIRALWFLLFWSVASSLAAQAPTPAEEPSTVQVFGEAVDVRVVNLEAVVTGPRGVRVKGLKPEDFKLRVDGVLTPVTFSTEIDEAKRPSQAAAQGAVDLGGEGARAEETTWQSRNILVFLDEATMLKARRDFVVRSMVEQLDQLAPGDRMAIVAYDGSRLVVLSDWTDDRARLSATLAAVEARPSQGIHEEVSRRQAANNRAFLAQASGRSIPTSRNQYGDAHTDGLVLPSGDRQTDGTASLTTPATSLPTDLFGSPDRYVPVGDAAAAAMRGVGAVPGRKMMLLLTEGFPHRVAGGPVVYEANRLGYSLYPVDVQGMDSFQAQNDVEFSGTPPTRPYVLTARDQKNDETLGAMAAATGGKAALGSNRLVALGHLVEDSTTYYLLGFSPTWRGNDRRHKIELKVRGTGLRVRTRGGYDDLSRRSWLSLEAEAGILLGRARSEPRLVFTIGELAAGGRARTATLGVPMESLAFFPHEKGFRAEAPVAVVAVDNQGKRTELPSKWLVVEVPKLPRVGTYAKLSFTIPATKQARQVFVSVHDALSGEVLWAEATLEPERPK